MSGSTIAVTGLFRYPVKSMGGEQTDSLRITAIGPVGDRNWAVIDTEARSIRSAKRWPALLGYRARYLTPPGVDAYGDAVSPVEIRAPSGGVYNSDAPGVQDWLSGELGRPVCLSSRQPAHDRDHYRLPGKRTDSDIASELGLVDGEVLPDFSTMTDSLLAPLQIYATPPGSYVDAFPVHVITQNSLDRLKAECGLDTSVLRFRPNLLLSVSGADGSPELGWIGRRLKIGELVLTIHSPTLRCAMPSRAQPLFDLPAEPGLTRALVNHCRRLLGVNAIVEQGGVVHRGDAVQIL
jgi:uncharacterized protein YcbX